MQRFFFFFCLHDGQVKNLEGNVLKNFNSLKYCKRWNDCTNLKCIWSHFFCIISPVQSIVNVKVLPNKNLVMFLALKTTQFLSRNGQDTGTRFYCAISSRDVVDRINHKEGFLRQNNMSSDSELTDFSKSPMHAVSYCNLVSLVHNTTLSGHFDHVIRRPFLRAKSHNFQARCYKVL